MQQGSQLELVNKEVERGLQLSGITLGLRCLYCNHGVMSVDHQLKVL